MDKKKKEFTKLSKLLQHWANHNNSHKESFLKWRNIAMDNNREDVAEEIDNAIEMMDRCTEHLLSAKFKIE